MISLWKHAKKKKVWKGEKSDLIECCAKIDSRRKRGEKNENFCLKISERKSRSHENKFDINIISIGDDGGVG